MSTSLISVLAKYNRRKATVDDVWTTYVQAEMSINDKPTRFQRSVVLSTLLPSSWVQIAQLKMARAISRTRVNFIISRLRKSNQRLVASDYAMLIQLFGAVRDMNRLKAIWSQLREENREITTEVYNAYLKALGNVQRSVADRRKALGSAMRLWDLIENIEADHNSKSVPDSETYRLLVVVFRNGKRSSNLLRFLKDNFCIGPEHLIGKAEMPKESIGTINKAMMDTVLSALGHLRMYGAMWNFFKNASVKFIPDVLTYQIVSRYLVVFHKEIGNMELGANARLLGYGQDQLKNMVKFAGPENVYKLIVPPNDIEYDMLIDGLSSKDARLYKPWLKLLKKRKTWGLAMDMLHIMKNRHVTLPPNDTNLILNRFERNEMELKEKEKKRKAESVTETPSEGETELGTEIAIDSTTMSVSNTATAIAPQTIETMTEGGSSIRTETEMAMNSARERISATATNMTTTDSAKEVVSDTATATEMEMDSAGEVISDTVKTSEPTTDYAPEVISDTPKETGWSLQRLSSLIWRKKPNQ